MGLNAAVLELLSTHCRRSEPGTALAAGYPDVLVPAEDMQRIMGTKSFPRDKSALAIKRTHGGMVQEVFDAEALFDSLGYTLNVIDINATRGCEVIRDLNYPADLGSYDLVFDHGTSEHVFNVGESGLSLARAVKIGGFLVMHLPLAFMDHGFYNLNPEWFYALCRHCGFKIAFLSGWSAKEGYFPTNISVLPERAHVSMVAVRHSEGSKGYPIQDLYA